MIHESHDVITLSLNMILQLHRDLYRFGGDAFAGQCGVRDNVEYGHALFSFLALRVTR